MSPQYVGFVDAIKLFFNNYTNFKGRSTRSEYWYAVLFQIAVEIVLYVLLLATKAGLFSILYMLFGLGTIVPSLAISVRRMHDIGKPWYWILLCLIPIAGPFIYIYFAVQPSGPANEWGGAPSA